MYRLARVIPAIVAACVLAACGALPKIDSTPEVMSKVGSIAVIRPPETKTYTVMNFGHPGVAFGLIGGLIAAGDLSSKQDRVTEALKTENFAGSAVLASDVAARLSRQGFQAKVEDGPWVENDGKFTLAFDKIQSNADAVLVIAPTIVGFVATGIGGDYMPTMTVVVTLLARDRKTQIYRGYHVAGWQPKRDGWRHTPAKITFTNFDALMADPKATASSLNDAALAVGATIAGDLKR